MDRATYLSKIENELKNTKQYLLKFLEKDLDYGFKLAKWVYELAIKNFMIKYNPKKEKVNRLRQRVYWIDFGVNVGSEFNYPHFCVVVKEFDNTAIVVPISTVKEDDPEWKHAGNLVVEIGCLDDLPYEKNPSYAMINQIKTVSKQRLSDYKDNKTGKYVRIELNEHQMQKIFDAINSISMQKINVKKP